MPRLYFYVVLLTMMTAMQTQVRVRGEVVSASYSIREASVGFLIVPDVRGDIIF